MSNVCVSLETFSWLSLRLSHLLVPLVFSPGHAGGINVNYAESQRFKWKMSQDRNSMTTPERVSCGSMNAMDSLKLELAS